MDIAAVVTQQKTAKGRDRVDLFADVNLGVFGLLRPDSFTGVATADKTREAISLILKEFTFAASF